MSLCDTLCTALTHNLGYQAGNEAIALIDGLPPGPGYAWSDSCKTATRYALGFQPSHELYWVLNTKNCGGLQLSDTLTNAILRTFGYAEGNEMLRCLTGAPLLSAGLLAAYPFDEGASLPPQTTMVSTRDGSGNGNTANANAGNYPPIWNSAKGLGFWGYCPLNLPASMAGSIQSIQIFFDCRPTPDPQWWFGTQSQWHQSLFYTSSSPLGDVQGVLTEPSMTYGQSVSSTENTQCGASLTHQGDICLTHTFGNPNKVYLGNQLSPMHVPSSSAFSAANPTWLTLGMKPGNFANGFARTMYYALLYSTILTPAQIAQNIDYVGRILAARGIKLGNIIPPASNQILFDGDGLMAGQSGGGNAHPFQGHGTAAGIAMQFLTKPCASAILGVTDRTSATILANAPTYADVLWANYTGPQKAYVLWVGSSDIQKGGVGAGTTAYNNIKARCAAARAAGANLIIVIDCINRTAFTAPMITEQTALNSALRADSPTLVSGIVYKGASYCDYLVDAQSLPQLQTPSNTAYFANDGWHLIPPGAVPVGQGLSTALAAGGIT
jgi:hypothetical protein